MQSILKSIFCIAVQVWKFIEINLNVGQYLHETPTASTNKCLPGKSKFALKFHIRI